MGFQIHAEALPHFTIVCHVRFPLRAKAASHPWGHTHMRPSRSVSNNYHATNHQPIRNKGAKKKRRATVQNGGRAADARALPRLRGIWGIRFACRMTAGQNSSSNEALLCMASVSRARDANGSYNPASGGFCAEMHDRYEKGHRIRDDPETPQEYLQYDCVIDTG